MNEKIVVIGQGYLTTYLMPCYERLLGENISENMIGIKGSSRDLEKRQAECKYPVVVGNVRETLEQRRPDIIILGVKPHQIAEMTEKTLVPYYAMLRRNGESLPDLYSFAPDPTVDYFTDTLGADVRAANMIPNMVSRIRDVFVAPIGVSFVSFDPRTQWPEENRSRAMDFLIPTGSVVEIPGDKAISFLAAQCASHLMYEFNYIAVDVLKEKGCEVNMTATASAYRAAFRDVFNDPSVNVLPFGAESVSEKLFAFMKIAMEAFFRGVIAFEDSEEIPHAASVRLTSGSMETFQMEAQLESREVLVQNTKNHATPGGFLEMCMKTFYARGYQLFGEHMRAWLDGNPSPDAARDIENIAFEVTKAIAVHGKTVSGVKK